MSPLDLIEVHVALAILGCAVFYVGLRTLEFLTQLWLPTTDAED